MFLVLAAVILLAVLLLWLRAREIEFQQGLRAELLRKLERHPADAASLIEELRRSGPVRVARVYTVIERLEAEALISSERQEQKDGRPRRVYSRTALPERLPEQTAVFRKIG